MRAKVLKISCHVQLTMVMRLTDLIVKLGSECVRLHQWTGAPAPAPSVPAPPSGSRTNSALALEAEKYYVERGLQVFGVVGAPNYHGVPQMRRKWELAVEDMVKHPPLEGDLPASVMPLYKQLCAVLRDSAPVCAHRHAYATRSRDTPARLRNTLSRRSRPKAGTLTGSSPEGAEIIGTVTRISNTPPGTKTL